MVQNSGPLGVTYALNKVIDRIYSAQQTLIELTTPTNRPILCDRVIHNIKKASIFTEEDVIWNQAPQLDEYLKQAQATIAVTNTNINSVFTMVKVS